MKSEATILHRNHPLTQSASALLSFINLDCATHCCAVAARHQRDSFRGLWHIWSGVCDIRKFDGGLAEWLKAHAWKACVG